MDDTTFLAGAVVALVALYRALCRPPAELLPVAAVLTGIALVGGWELLPLAAQELALRGAELGLLAVGGYAGGKTLVRRP